MVVGGGSQRLLCLNLTTDMVVLLFGLWLLLGCDNNDERTRYFSAGWIFLRTIYSQKCLFLRNYFFDALNIVQSGCNFTQKCYSMMLSELDAFRLVGF